MENDSREFALFIDGLRIDRNTSREDLCEGIISLSQYKRYLRGVTSIPNNIVIFIADKLQLSISDLHLLYRNRSDNQYHKVNEIYQLIISNNFEKAYILANNMKKDIIVSSPNQMFYDFCLLNIQHHLMYVSDIQVLELYSRLINYPDEMNKDSYSWVEINVLMQIVQISAKMENYEPTNLMYTLLKNEEFIKSYTGEGGLIPGIYATIAKILGRQAKNEQVIEISKIAIQYCVKHEISASLSHLYFFTSFAYHKLDEIELAKENSKKGFMQLYLEDKPDKFEIFKVIFEKMFEMDLDELICLKM
jgi:hypothetical protein